MRKIFMYGLVLGLSQAWLGGSGHGQEYRSNMTQIGVTRALHTSFVRYAGKNAKALAIGIAILDGRADQTHRDLKASLSNVIVYRGSYRYYDDHGTHVAGIAGADIDGRGIVGVAPTARLFSIPVFDDWGWVAYDMGALALSRAAKLGVRAVNMSYGPIGTGDVFLDGELDVLDNYRTIVLVRAAGNSGADMQHEYYAGDASVDLSNLLIVGSVDADNSLSWFSNSPGSACIGASVDCDESDKAKNFFLVAPGSNIYSNLPKNSFGTMSGTSMAAPHVTGAAALVFQEAIAGNVKLSAADVARILKETATDLGDPGVDSVFGWGLLNVQAALGPIGPLSVATAGTVDSGRPLRNAQFTQSSVMGDNSVAARLLDGMVVFDKFGRGFVMQEPDATQAESSLAQDSLAALHASLGHDAQASVSQPGAFFVMSMGDMLAHFTQAPPADGHASLSRELGRQFFTGAGDVADAVANGFQTGADFTLTPALTFSTLYVQGLEAGNGLASLGAGLMLDDSRKVSVSYGLLREQDSLLGSRTEGAFALGAAYTNLLGISYSQEISAGLRADVFAQAGFTQSQPPGSSLFTQVSDAWSAKLGLSLTASSLLQAQDSFQISLTSPWHMLSGQAEARVPVGRELDGTVLYESRNLSLADDAVPLDLGFTYTAKAGAVSYGGALWLRDADAAGLGVDEAAAVAAISLNF